MTVIGELAVNIAARTGAFQKGLRRAEKHLGTFSRRMDSIARRGLAFGTAVGAGLGVAVKRAADAQESLNRFEAVFDTQAKAAAQFADSLAGSVGRSALEIKEGLSTFQSFFVGLGFGQERASSLSQKMQELSVDFASFNNLSDAEALERFISALSGSSEVLDKFGVNIRQAALQQEMMSRGVNKAWTEVTEQEKAISRLNVIMKVMTDQGAVGDAARTAGSFTNRMKALRATISETAVSVGSALLPPLTELAQRAAEVGKRIAAWASNNQQAVRDFALMTAKVVGASAAMFALGKAAGGLIAVLRGLRVAMTLISAHPLAALLTALGAAAIYATGSTESLIGMVADLGGVAASGIANVTGLTGALDGLANTKLKMPTDELSKLELKIAQTESKIGKFEAKHQERLMQNELGRANMIGRILGAEREKLERLQEQRDKLQAPQARQKALEMLARPLLSPALEEQQRRQATARSVAQRGIFHQGSEMLRGGLQDFNEMLFERMPQQLAGAFEGLQIETKPDREFNRAITKGSQEAFELQARHRRGDFGPQEKIVKNTKETVAAVNGVKQAVNQVSTLLGNQEVFSIPSA